MDKSALNLEEVLGLRDEQLLQKLSVYEPAILDEVADYHLSRVGCATTDSAATRLLSVAVQVAFEKAVDEAKLILASSRGDPFARRGAPWGQPGSSVHPHYDRGSGDASAQAASTGSSSGDVKELDMDSLCKALQRNGTMPLGPTLDLLLQPVVSENEPGGA
ncbi:uncharacterized protein LOC34622804 [Cyclospora cayetanensis]|uniref:Uncharacterized protein LOC34622804 n=2 Tax=Cyclospora cayetanensis TaxID=88456 RepID=A0A6P5WDD4_9EIME|nr:uncharacterized protein LOC34622804 [Cyclospora cayetanensis]OEH76832.1 hypothetical protein cyc_06694 [Cyclospora cayetanensis]